MSRFAAISTTFHHLLLLVIAVQLVSFFSGTSLVVAQTKELAGPTTHYLQDQDFLTLTNQARLSRGLAPLVINPELTQAAEQKALDMYQKGYWEHFRPTDHKAPWDFIKESGYDYRVAGENLAKGFQTPQGITKAWLASPTHLANIISPNYTEVGFATVESTDSQGQVVLLTVQMFGSR